VVPFDDSEGIGTHTTTVPRGCDTERGGSK
jgi:hypothetical protein